MTASGERGGEESENCSRSQGASRSGGEEARGLTNTEAMAKNMLSKQEEAATLKDLIQTVGAPLNLFSDTTDEEKKCRSRHRLPISKVGGKKADFTAR